MFRVLDVLTVQWATDDLPEECRFLVQYAADALEQQKEPATKMFDDDELIRSLTAPEAITAGTPEGQATHVAPDDTSQDQRVDSKKVRPIQMGEFVRKHVAGRFQALSGGEIAAPMTAMRQVKVGSQELGPWQSFTNSSLTKGWQDLWTHPWHVSMWTKNCFGMSEGFAVNVLQQAAFSPSTQQQQAGSTDLSL